ncbi:MAG TPA: ferrous iron transport protein B [Candidatus Limnocylindrales bacterium]
MSVIAAGAPIAVDDVVIRDTAAVAAGHVPVVALVGRPNVGKSTFFASVSGRYAETANVPGTTIVAARREIHLAGMSAVLVDLPGALSLGDASDGTAPFWQMLLAAQPDALLVIVDAGDLGRHLPLVLACRDLGLPIVVAANLSDEAAGRGISLDTGRLSQLLVAPVFRTIGRRSVGTREAVAAAIYRAAAFHARALRTTPFPPYMMSTVAAVNALARDLSKGSAAQPEPALMNALGARSLTPVAAATIALEQRLDAERWQIAAHWTAQVEARHDVPRPVNDRLARMATSPRIGLPLLAVLTAGVLLITMFVGTWLANLLGMAWSNFVSPIVTGAVDRSVPIPALQEAIKWALDSGLLAMLTVGLPFVLIFLVIIAALEDSGYLASTAVLTDRLFNAVGLPGRAMIPIFTAAGCNVPAIYSTRVLDTRRERLLASLLIVMTPCSARSAVVVAALAPFVGPFVALAAFGVILLTTIVSGVASNALLPGRQSPVVLDIPPLRLPVPRQVAAKAWFRFKSFVRTAAPIMIVGSFVLGLVYSSGANDPIEQVLSPVTVGMLGLPPVVGVALVLAFLRKELALQLLVVLSVAEIGPAAANLNQFMSPEQLFVYAVVTAISVPCIASMASLVDEFGWRSALAIAGALLGIGIALGTVLNVVLS